MDGKTSTEEYERRRSAVADKILAEPEHFDMNTWGMRSARCGTVACLAGTAALIAQQEGLCTITWYNEDGFMQTMDTSLSIDSGGEAKSVASFARDYLGLPGRQLFYELSLTAEEAAKALLDAPYPS